MKLKKTKLGKLNFWYRNDDKFIGQRIALGKYEKYETAIMLGQLNINSIVVDVGANIGYYTLQMAQRAKKVYAIEPYKECFEILKKNVKENNLGKRKKRIMKRPGFLDIATKVSLHHLVRLPRCNVGHD